MEFYHNPRCSTSRNTLALLREKGIEPEIREYLNSPPTYEELDALIRMLGIKAQDLIRQKEPIFIEKYKGKERTRKQWIQAMVKYPILIERPIFIHNGKAALGRPPEKVLEIL